MHLEVATVDKFQFDLKKNGKDIGSRVLIWFLSSHCILCLVLDIWNQEKYRGLYDKFFSSTGHISTYSDNAHVKFSTLSCFEVRFHSMLPTYENSKSIIL